MTFDPKYGYTRIENKSFTLGGHARARAEGFRRRR